MAGAGLWVRWSLRDLRKRWLQVAVIALVAGLGSGAYTGLGSASTWRRAAYDNGYAALAAHDAKVSLTANADVDAATLASVPGRLAHPGWVDGATVQLVVPTQVDASIDGRTILVPGRVVGVAFDGPAPAVDRFDLRSGAALSPSGRDGVLDVHFARHHGLPAAGDLRLGGNRSLRYTGLVLQPDYFLIMNDLGGFLAEAGYAVAFTNLEAAQELAGKPGRANQLVVRWAAGVDPGAAHDELAAAFAAAFPDQASTVADRPDERASRVLYDDIEGDQKFFNVFAFLIMAGAAFAAFNLASRVVEAQRREIGIGMALGVPPPRIAIRPLLVGLEVALAGVAFGVAVGVVVGRLVVGVFSDFFPMPAWATPFQGGAFARGAAIGVVLVFVATVYPVVRAVRVEPIDAIKVGLRETKPSGWAGLVQRLPLPGGSLGQMPVRNALRNPRRSLLTALGISAAIATLVGVLGTLDSFTATIDRGEREILATSPDRMLVTIDGFERRGGAATTAVQAVPGVAHADEGLRVVGRVAPLGPGEVADVGAVGTDGFDVVIDLLDMADAMWRPSLVAGSYPGDRPALVLSEKAATDMGVVAGGTVRLRHPRREGLGYRWTVSEVLVSGIHPNPYRYAVFMDLRHASLMNLDGIVNFLQVTPVPGTDRDAVVWGLFHLDGIASVVPVSTITANVRQTVGRVTDVLDIVQGVVLVLAVLIAFNSSSISADERARENATMFAFGVPVGRVLAMGVVESALIGLAATVLGVGLGRVVLAWIVHGVLPGTMPDLLVVTSVRGVTYLLAAALGIVAVAAAPVLTSRRLRRMPIADTLRIVE